MLSRSCRQSPQRSRRAAAARRDRPVRTIGRSLRVKRRFVRWAQIHDTDIDYSPAGTTSATGQSRRCDDVRGRSAQAPNAADLTRRSEQARGARSRLTSPGVCSYARAAPGYHCLLRSLSRLPTQSQPDIKRARCLPKSRQRIRGITSAQSQQGSPFQSRTACCWLHQEMIAAHPRERHAEGLRVA